MTSPDAQARRKLRISAAILWFSGAIVLLLKGSGLLQQALALRPDLFWAWLTIPAALLIGGIKTELVFERACRRNLERIATLEDGRIWQAYRPGFYLFLAAMVILGGTLSRLATGNYGGLVAMAVLDFSLATALLLSGRLFWGDRQQHRAGADDKKR